MPTPNTRNAAKRKKDDEFDEMENESDEMNKKLKLIADKIEGVFDIVSLLKVDFAKLMLENKEIKTELCNIRKINESLKCQLSKISVTDLNVKTNVTYADKLKEVSGPVVLIMPKDQNQKSDETKKVLKSKINPSENKISGIRKAANGAVVVECKDMVSGKNLETEAKNSMGENYEVQMPKRRNPKIKICGMTEKLSADEIIVRMINQNDFLNKDDDFKVVHISEIKKGNKLEQYQAILETKPVTYNKLMTNEKVYIKWDRCFVNEYVQITRCFKCLGFNHHAAACTKNKACRNCGGEHEAVNCSSVGSKCVNCLWYVKNFKMTMDVNHHPFSSECEVLRRKYQEEKRKIDLSE